MYPSYIPCFEHCYVKYGKQYEPERCDSECDYAMKCVENRELTKILKAVLYAHSSDKCYFCKYDNKCSCPEGHCNHELDLEKIKEYYLIKD